MIAKASIKYSRVSPTKVRPVIDMLRGKDVLSSQTMLMVTNKGSAEMIRKVLNSAISNAKQPPYVNNFCHLS